MDEQLKGALNPCFPAGRKRIIKRQWSQQKGEKPERVGRVARVVRVSSVACGGPWWCPEWCLVETSPGWLQSQKGLDECKLRGQARQPTG